MEEGCVDLRNTWRYLFISIRFVYRVRASQSGHRSTPSGRHRQRSGHIPAEGVYKGPHCQGRPVLLPVLPVGHPIGMLIRLPSPRG